MAAPQEAKIVSSPRLFIDARTGALNGLSNGGTHGKKGPEKPSDTDQCHDITVYSAIGLAAGACSGNGIVLDVKDPVHPKRVDAVNDPNYSYWHSASFSNDGSKVVFTDEWGGGLGARCRANDPNKWGADAIFNLKDDKLTFANYYKLPAAPGRHRELRRAQRFARSRSRARHRSAGVVSGRDFGDGFHRHGAPVRNRLFRSRTDRSEDARARRRMVGLLVQRQHLRVGNRARARHFRTGHRRKYLTQNEIDAAKAVKVAELNVQNQQKIEWPAKLVVAKAYLDQLGRSQALPAKRLDALNKAVVRAQTSKLGKKDVAKLQGMAASVETDAGSAKNAADAKRLNALAQILKSPAA